jgi:hypothetical protein
MQKLGEREVSPDATLEGRMAARLNAALDRQVAGEFYRFENERGLVDLAAEPHASTGAVRLSVEDVARICAQEARDWF